MFVTGVSVTFEFILIVFSLLMWLKDSPVKKANRSLALAFLFLAVVHLLLSFLYYVHTQKMYFLLAGYFPFDQILAMFIGPAIYFYVVLLFDGSRTVTPRQILMHALPALPATIYSVYFVTLPLSVRTGMLMNDADPKSWMDDALDSLFYIQSAAYLFVCFLRVGKQRKSDYQLDANGYRYNIRRLYQFLCLALAELLIYITFCVVHDCNDDQILLGTGTIDLVIVFIFAQVLWRAHLFIQDVQVVPTTTEPALIIDKELAKIYLQRIHEILDSTKIHLTNSFSLIVLSEYTGIPRHHISTTINNYTDYNFSGFINLYRYKHACALLESPDSQKLTIEAIGLQSGFSNRVNFYKIFKSFSGKSPSEYLADLNRERTSYISSETDPE
ncbi:MAG: helix-turn-helix domain-containing protein [Paludibacter sp.]|nr:helix-turn-helix domain-containing protein [Paludibacter sp.]